MTVVTVIGDLVEDIVVWTSRPFVLGTDNPAVVRRARGGSAANVAVAAALGGARARFIGRVGDDAIGAALVGELERDGVDVRVQRGGRTGCVVVVVHEDGERSMFPDRAAAAELGPIAADVLVATDVVHVPMYGFLDPAAATHLRDAVAAVVAAGGRSSVDLSATSVIERLGAPTVRGLIAEMQPALVFGNAAEARSARLDLLRPAPGGAFVVKDGPRPVRIVHEDGSYEDVAVGPVDVAVRDTTGAGDAFAGAFLARWAAGATMTEACRAGHRAASRTLAVAGATMDDTTRSRT